MSGPGGSERDATAPPVHEPEQTNSASPEQSSGEGVHGGGVRAAQVEARGSVPADFAQAYRPAVPLPSLQHRTAAGSGPLGVEAAAWERMGDELRTAGLIAERKIPSARGWRKWLRIATFGLVTLEQSPDERRVRELNAAVDSPLRGIYSVVVLGGKGGAGKTTVAIGVGSIFALLRNDKVVAIDGNPDIGANLAERVDPSTVSSYREVLDDNRLERYADMRSHVGQSPGSGLDVLAANRNVSGRKLLDAKTYFATHERLQRFYSVLVTDSGTNVEHPVVKGLLDNANSVIVVASTTPDSAQAAGRVMDWLRQSDYSELLTRCVVVLNDVTGRTGRKLTETLVEAFSRHVGDNRVFVLPHDPHLAAGGVFDIDELRPATRRRFLEITAAVAGYFTATVDAP
jgi:MinD-like ATPase involved in chromosome partitioning or flagellar assembly